ncbi:MAG: hypothetical protein C5B48_06825 [Candidatus Rokuibacteriota bacterium]|nr:MAG: hypothetical protein C5B48_06825 [Candidatus Rokubacteria bacterium]
MTRLRLPLFVVCTLALAGVAHAATPAAEQNAGVCRILCAYPLHCVPTPTGGKCVGGNGATDATLAPSCDATPAPSTDATPTPSTGADPNIAGGVCTLLCAYPLHCVPTPTGGKCVGGGKGATEAPLATPIDATPVVAGGFCVPDHGGSSTTLAPSSGDAANPDSFDGSCEGTLSPGV